MQSWNNSIMPGFVGKFWPLSEVLKILSMVMEEGEWLKLNSDKTEVVVVGWGKQQ